jgi:hypothetical protein
MRTPGIGALVAARGMTDRIWIFIGGCMVGVSVTILVLT